MVNETEIFFSKSQPKSIGDMSGESESCVCFQIHACRCVRFIFPVKLSVVGERDTSFGTFLDSVISGGLSFYAKNSK